MNKQKIINELEKKYPGKKIISIPDSNPSEILCEIDATKDHLEKSTAISIIDTSVPHFHKKTKEVYTVLNGSLKVHLNDKIVELKTGDILTIMPNTVHWAEGNETWIEVLATPGWIAEDHFFV